MLTREHAIATFKDGRIFPDRLTRVAHAPYRDFAARMLDVYRNGIGRTRGELHRDIAAILDADPACPPRRRDAFCKLLDEDRISEWDTDRGGTAARLRRRVFGEAARLHPLVTNRDALFERSEQDAKDAIAAELGRPWPDIESALFADVIEFHRLRAFQGYPDPADLLARYNVAQVQAALYRAIRITIRARQDFKIILRHAKLARLLHTVTREPGGDYCIALDGPDSILRETQRYGVQIARFLPALLACRGWSLKAVIRTSRDGFKPRLELSPADGLRSHLDEPEEFDSGLEAMFAKRWGEAPRDGWTLIREDEILHEGQHIFIPDFTFAHADGRRVHLEIVGFWTPEYLAEKVHTLARFRTTRLLLAVTEKVDGPAWPVDESRIIRFKTALKVDPVLAALDRCT